jgi:hypothetical protein
MIMNKLFGNVCYAAIDIDGELKYPKGAGRVVFSNRENYVAAIKARFIELKDGDLSKRAEIKPYVLENQLCGVCSMSNLNTDNINRTSSSALFCPDNSCLKYYCDTCWMNYHSLCGREYHKPLIKEGNDRPKIIQFNWH